MRQSQMISPIGNEAKAVRSKVPLIVFIIIGLAILLGDSLMGSGFASDIDDYIRHMQIRDLLADNQWHDRTLPMIAMPEAYVSPWSRLVDAPYYLVTKILGLIVPMDQALDWAELIVPSLLFFPFAWLTVKTARTLAPAVISPLIWTLTTLIAAFTLTEFTPGRIDHHNMQLICMMAMAYGLVHQRAMGGYIISGAILCSVAIGLETLPFIFTALIGLMGFAIWGHELIRQKLVRTGAVLFIATLPLTLLLVGKTTAFSTQCDAISAPWVVGLTGGGAILAVTRLWPVFAHAGARLKVIKTASFLIPSLLLIAICALLFRACLEGPYHMIDPVSKSFWLNDVAQEKSLFWLGQKPHGTAFVGVFLAASFLFLISVLKIIDHRRTLSSGVLILTGITILSIVLTVYQIRFYRFPLAFICVLLPFGLSGYDETFRAAFQNRKTLLAAFLIPFVGLVGLFVAAPKTPEYIDGRYAMDTAVCDADDIALLDQYPPGRIIAPLSFSTTIALHTNTHKVAAIPFHRASPGIRRVAQLFGNALDDARREAIAPYDYMAVCMPVLSADLSDTPFFEALISSNTWPGLTELTAKPDSPFRLYKIDHNQFR